MLYVLLIRSCMPRLLLFIALFLVFTCARGQRILTQDYNFIGRGMRVSKLHQSNDTIYQFSCNAYAKQFYRVKPDAHYKIISSSKQAEFYILKLEQLDTVSLTTEPYPKTRYSLLILKNGNSKEVGSLPRLLGSTRSQIDTSKVNLTALRNNFYFTYFSDTYMKSLASLKTIATKHDAEVIFETIKDGTFKELIDKYQQTQPGDLYASGLISELINRACINNGYNPLGAQQKINDLLK